MKFIKLQLRYLSTSIFIAPGEMRRFGQRLAETLAARRARPRAIIVTDERVDALYGERLSESLAAQGLGTEKIRVKPGEASKSLAVAERLWSELAARTAKRDDLVVALGGGVVSDLAGFVAATWMRGIAWAVCPTTLEAAIDASIGGKTAVNISAGKNLIGAFHHPILVVIDPACLRTLDARDFRAGLAESVKHALLDSEEFVAWHEVNAGPVLSSDETILTELIVRNVRIKSAIVEQDDREQTGKRMLLNLGHTIGHAVETAAGYSLRHGECVSLGLVAACRISQRLGLLDPCVTNRVETLLARLGLPTRLTEPIETARILAALHVDKKRRSGALHVVLLEAVGRPVIRPDVPDSVIGEVYESIQS